MISCILELCRYQRIVGANVDMPGGNQMHIKGEDIAHGVNQIVRPRSVLKFAQPKAIQNKILNRVHTYRWSTIY